jgi:hypothetical protein
MWITSDNQTITSPRGITINGIQHPQSIFQHWSKDELASIGIKPYHPAYPPTGERVTSSSTEERDGEIYEVITTEPVPPQPDIRTYAEKRVAEYPSLSDLNVALWEKVVENRPEAADALEIVRQQIKAKYPKPEVDS